MSESISVAVRRGNRLLALEAATKFAARFVQGDLGTRETAHLLIHSGAFDDDAEMQAEIAKLEASREAEHQTLARICRVGARKLEGCIARSIQEHADQHMLRAFLAVVEMALAHLRRAETVRAPSEGARWPVPDEAKGMAFVGTFGDSMLRHRRDFDVYCDGVTVAFYGERCGTHPRDPVEFWSSLTPAQSLALLRAAPKIAGPWERVDDKYAVWRRMRNDSEAAAVVLDHGGSFTAFAIWSDDEDDECDDCGATRGDWTTRSFGVDVDKMKAAADAALAAAGWLLVDD